MKLFNNSKLLKYFVFGIVLCTYSYSQNIIKGPYLFEPGNNSITIRWETNGPSNCVIKYGLDSILNLEKAANIRGIKNGGYLYEANLNCLKQGKQYSYQIIADSIESSNYEFETFTTSEQNIQFVAMGDSRSNPSIFKNIISDVNEENPDFVISMGDLVENGGNYEQWGDYYFSVAKSLISNAPLVSTLGDHEGDGDEGELFRHYLRTTQSTDKQWFSFDYGDAHFISLDYRHPDSQEMIDWFVQNITSSRAKWNFIYMHRPCYNMGGHRSTWGRGNWPNLFSTYKIDIVFAGHSHIYERFHPISSLDNSNNWPVTYITTGGAGAGLYDISQSPFLAEVESVNHFVTVKISGDTLNAQAIRNDGSLLDNFCIIKNNNSYDKNYLSNVLKKEELDNLTMFTSGLSSSIEPIPLSYFAGKLNIEFTPVKDESIPFTIKLSEKSADSFEMTEYSGVLNGNKSVQVPLSVYTKTDITISPWGDITPDLLLQVIYTDQFGEKLIEGGRIGYWPDEDGY